jgi:hypothetical protein
VDAPEAPPSDAPPAPPETLPELPALAAPPSAELVPALAPPELAFDALAPPLLDPPVVLPEGEEFDELHAASAAVMVNVAKRASLVGWEFFMRWPRSIAIVPSGQPNGSRFIPVFFAFA